MADTFAILISLEWRHNGCDGVSNHQPHHCLLNRLFNSGADQIKHQSSLSLAFVRGVHRRSANPHKWPVTRKMFPFDDVIISIHDKEYTLFICLVALCTYTSTICHKSRAVAKVSIGLLLLTPLWFLRQSKEQLYMTETEPEITFSPAVNIFSKGYS